MEQCFQLFVQKLTDILYSDANSVNYIHQKNQQAEAIWFAGDDQWNYVSYWRNTEIQLMALLPIEI
ncbi:hypothetical protein [uncultured Kordia sp.]|uniref:hypothetical protein n=1 Tax=uncultured Kordia sp. TaxID=507699 RepID=UPI00261E6E61|nr:hypothetical protein [uncultured Kordia sp.]